MVEPDTLMPSETHATAQDGRFDPVAAMMQARDKMLAEAQETWDSIQAMEASPERVRMEAEFSRTSAELLSATQADPFFRDHATIAEPGDDLFANLTLSSLQHVREGLGADDPRVGKITRTLDDLRDALTSAFSKDPEVVAQMGTAPEELAGYVLQGAHSLAQAAMWRARAESLDEESSARLTVVLEKGHRIVDGVAVPRDLAEHLALDQLLTVDKHHQLADVPAIEALVDRMAGALSNGDLAKVFAGDRTPPQDEIRDPAVRAAVAAELKNEADVVAGHGPREGETVEAYQAMRTRVKLNWRQSGRQTTCADTGGPAAASPNVRLRLIRRFHMIFSFPFPGAENSRTTTPAPSCVVYLVSEHCDYTEICRAFDPLRE
ncbi:hypothetical protein SAMN04488105_1232 [Salipiger thiooxidans]|uniref:Uncharacterized protein n=2 Tax=Salipiger thiooxidans TaxID=282683 RepID=A0A1G7LBY9_9RHOB|nr:hypothetical protein SAMN04488105_1232 [Salipiger thiooxidans]